MKIFNIIYTIIVTITGWTIVFASESPLTNKQKAEKLEKKINNQLKYTIEEKVISVTCPKRTKINDLVQNTIELGTLKHTINQIPREIPLSSARKFIIETLESLGLRQPYTLEEKNKAKAVATELEYKKNNLKNLCENNYFNQPDQGISFRKITDTPCYQCNFPYDMAKFDKAIHDQKRITGEALLPYMGNTEGKF